MSVLATIATGVTVGVIVAVVGNLINRSLLKNMEKKERDKTQKAEEEIARNKAIAKGVLALLHNELYPMLEQALFRGAVGYDEFDNMAHLMDPYRALGGNGTAERRFNQVDKLPRVKDDELSEYDRTTGEE